MGYSGRYGLAAKVDAVPQMHQAHAKAAQDKTGSSLRAKKDGFSVSDVLDKIRGRFFADMFYQRTVLPDDRLQRFLKGRFFTLCAVFRCRVLFQSSLLKLDGRHGTSVK